MSNHEEENLSEAYKNIARAIYDKSEKENTDVRNLIREWCGLFESSRVVGFDRMKFLDACNIERKRREEHNENPHRL